MMVLDLSHPQAIVERGERIYRDSYKTAFEAEHFGKFVAIDVTTEQAYLGDTAERALEGAKEQAPHGIFHLIRVGSPGAFRVSRRGSHR
jgi:hypothetical protein